MINYLRNNLKAIAVIFLGFIFIFIGIYRNEVNTVFTKAIMICLECIGIG